MFPSHANIDVIERPLCGSTGAIVCGVRGRAGRNGSSISSVQAAKAVIGPSREIEHNKIIAANRNCISSRGE